jgi:hypothetical protein
VTLSENQFFRLKYIDPKMTGYKVHLEELRAAQSAVQFLQDALKKKLKDSVSVSVSALEGSPRKRYAITRASADQSHTLRIPVHMNESMNKCLRASREL